MGRLARAAVLALLWAFAGAAGWAAPADRVVVFRDGLLRWEDSGAEVALFGVNYYAPFYSNYPDLGKLGVNRDAVVRQDVAHWKRLGLDLLRVHVFDREVSDPEGNLVDNDQLRLLDYLVAECKRNGIYTVFTPIAWWPTGRKTTGFSDRWTMPQMVTDPSAREAQRRYLAQFVRHRNRYTGLTYGEDPAVVALELINEPIPPPDTPDAAITGYIDSLADAVRGAGCAKPLFYNGWGGRLGAVAASTVQGCTFGWYPTGLGAGRTLRGPHLQRVADYPDMRSPVLAGKAIGVYEFDAADVAEPSMYPAMARAFRAGGAQFAAQFQYDPLPLAPYNAGWHTHYLNLAHTPAKAVSFMIAAEAFRALPRRHAWRAYPANHRFGEFRVSHAEALSERVSETALLHSNTTRTRPPRPDRLQRIAGCGSSPVVRYNGTGAYFLDRLAPGAWRLEVYPDAVWVDDPFSSSSLGHEVSRTYHRARTMRVSLPDLGPGFVVTPAVRGAQRKAAGGAVTVRPGVYLLARPGARPPAGWQGAPFVAPRDAGDRPAAVRHAPAQVLVRGRAVRLSATVAAPGAPAVRVRYRTAKTAPWRMLPMRAAGPYAYTADIPAARVAGNALAYAIEVESAGRKTIFPGGRPASEQRQPTPPATVWRAVVGSKVPRPTLGRAEIAVHASGGPVLHLTAPGFGPPPSAAGVRLPATPAKAAGLNTMVVAARALLADTSAVEVGLVQDDGQAYGCDVPLTLAWREIRIPLNRLRPLWTTTGKALDPARIRQVSFAYGAWLFADRAARPHGLEVSAIRLEQESAAWSVPILPAGAPIPLVTGDTPMKLDGTPGTAYATTGREGPAIRLVTEGFEPGAASSARVDVRDALAPWTGLVKDRGGVRLRVRAGETLTDAVELVLVEADGAPWGANVPLTREWRDIRINWSDLRFFRHWAHPPGRGGSGDRLKPESLAEVVLTYGAWLYPGYADRRHAVEVEGVWLEP